MKTARLAILGIALAAGAGAFYLMMGSKPEPVPTPVVAPVVPPKPVPNMLVAARDIPFGTVLGDGDMRWKPMPEGSPPAPADAIIDTTTPSAMQDFRGAVVRATVGANEPLLAGRLAKRNGSGFMAAVLPAGMRAVAIDLADQGKTAAGGFILPNDRVDVIRTFHPDDQPQAVASETILVGIRVLAIGQSVQEKSTERTVIGGTATLEMTPDQAEKVVLAQRTGQLTLSLRSMGDFAKTDELKPPPSPTTMTIIRSGNASQSRVK